MHFRATACLAVIAAALLFDLFTIRGGQPWPDDFAMYVHEAQNIAGHISLSHTGYIYDPLNPSLGPRLYPPIFPAFLAPAYKIGGGLSNLLPMKLEIVLFFVAMLVVLWRSLAKDLSFGSQLALLALVGFNPLLWSYKDLITSDLPFTFFFLVTLAFADWCARARPVGTENVWRVALLALLIYLSYGIRTMGIVLVPGILIIAASESRRSGKPLAAAAVIGLVPCVIQAKLFGGESSYIDQLRLTPIAFLHTVLHNVMGYGWSLATFWDNPYSKIARDLLFAIVTVFALVGYLNRIRFRPRVYEVVLPFYLAIVLSWPNPAGARYLIPIFPLYVCYLLEGVEYVSSIVSLPRLAPALAVSMSLLIALSYVAQYAHAEFGPYRDGIAKDQSKALFSYIQSNTDPHDIFIFRRPRAFALFTGRNAAIYPEPRYVSQFTNYFESINTNYLVEAPLLDDPEFDRFVETDCQRKNLVFSNSDFRVYRLQTSASRACRATSSLANRMTSNDPSSP